MKKDKNNSIVSIATNQYIDLGLYYSGEKNILIIGNFDGLFGEFKTDDIGQVILDYANVNPKTYDNLRFLVEGLKNNCRFDFIHNECGTENLENLANYLRNTNIGVRTVDSYLKHKAMQSNREYLEFIDKLIENNMKFDYIIQNPPYSGSLHLEFLKKGLELLKEKSGKMTIIEPATWLINVRKNGKAKLYDEIKEIVKGHVSKVVIENYNKEFGTGLFVPFGILNVDFGQTFEDIEFQCCGEKKIVKSLYDCNLIGDYEKIWSILNKVKQYNDMMSYHIFKENTNKHEIYYAKYAGLGPGGCIERDKSNPFKHFLRRMCCDDEPISHNIPHLLNASGKLTNKLSSTNLFGTFEELTNWKHFVYNNKLPQFISIVMTIDQHNNSLDYVPWLVDKQYTDEEIAKLFDFTQDELDLIDHTLKKYDIRFPWFKRYLRGKDSVTNEEVQKFIDSI